MPATRPNILALLLAAMFLAGCSGEATAEGLPPAEDLGDLPADQPVILAFTADDCPYCEYVKDSHLIPMQKRGEDVTIREVDVGSSRELTTFAGDTMEAQDLGSEYSVQVTPTLVFLTPGGETAAESLVGVSSEDYYGSYLERRIEDTREAVAEE
ncbi:MAG: thioredoxin fold domain-containing protein [Pseudomonadota bacterium]